MPTYVYKFLDREGTIEVQQAFTDAALTEAVHPVDGLVHPVKKVFTPVGVSFKGNGFYKTDNRGSGSPASTSSKSEGKSEGKSEAKSDGGSGGGGESTASSPAPAAAASTST